MAELRVRVETAALAQGLQKVRGALGKKDGIQALTYVLFNIGAEGITLTSFNQAISARVKVHVPPDTFGGRTFGFCMDGRFAADMATSAKGELFDIVFQEEDILKQGQNASFYARVNCGDAEWTPLCIPDSSYPLVSFQQPGQFTVLRTALLEALDKSVPVITDIARSLGENQNDASVMNSFGLHWRDGYLEAGGGGRYTIVRIPGLADGAKFNFVLPPDGARVLYDMAKLSGMDTVQFGISAESEASFQFGPDSLGIFTAQNYWLDLVAKLENPVETSKRDIFAVDKVLFTGAIEQVQFLSEGEHGVRLQKNGNTLLVYADDEVGQKGKVVVRVQWRTQEDYDISFNWEFLKDLARTFGSDKERTIVVKEGLTAGKKPILYVESAGIKTFILPLRGMGGRAPTPPQAVPVAA